MRLSEDKIKQGILHPDRHVREMAVRYFAESLSPDRDVMPLVIQAVDTYGRDAVSGYCFREGLAQTDETLRWILAELAEEEDMEDEDSMHRDWGLCNLLAQADAHLLARHESEIMETPGIALHVREAITERIRLRSADPDTCWTDLGEFCEREKDTQYVNEADLPHANRLVEAIARHGERYAGRVLSLLEEEVEDYSHHPMGWMEPLVVRLAGEMPLEAAVGPLVKKLHEEGDLLIEECQRALWRIGSDAVVEEVCEDFSEAEWSYRLCGAAVLQRIHSDLTLTKCLELLPREEDADIRVWLGQAILRQFSFEGMEPLRQLILEAPLDPEMLELCNDFLAACTLMEVEFPEMDAWKADAERERERIRELHAPRYEAFDADDFDEAYLDDELDDELDEEPAGRPEPIIAQWKTGRNDPCPCGSGKKFKKCCLKKQKSELPFD